jgi:glycosyltransferase involved in cell wall biosynthesis
MNADPAASGSDRDPTADVRVGLNLLWVDPGVVGGSEDYVVGLLDGLCGLADRPDITLFVGARFADAYRELCGQFTTVVAPGASSATGAGRVVGKVLRVSAENTWLPGALRRAGIQLLHHLGGVIPFADRARHRQRILTVHDLQPLEFPGNFSTLKRWYLQRAIPSSVRRADAISTLSSYVANDVAQRFHVPVNRFALVPPGTRRALGNGDAAAFLRSLGLEGCPYLLYPAITYPHKNHTFLVQVFARLSGTRPELRLVLTGGAAQSEDAVRAAIADAGVADRVLRPGRVSSDELVALYGGAAAVVFPSRFEGFGLPVLEAMRLGCPVVASTVGGLPEVLAGAGELVDPDDQAGWVDAIGRVLDDVAMRERMVAAGHQRAAAFTWQHTAEAAVQLWRRVAAGEPAGRPGEGVR